MTDDELGAVGRIAAVAALAGLLLLLAPWTPPQVAVFGFVALFVLGVVTYVGLSYVVTELARGWGLAETDDEDGDEDADELARLKERYLTDPSFDEADFEDAVEEAVAADGLAEDGVAGDVVTEDGRVTGTDDERDADPE